MENPATSREKVKELEIKVQAYQEEMRASNKTVLNIEKKLQDVDTDKG